jgi:hypothetical protein
MIDIQSIPLRDNNGFNLDVIAQTVAEKMEKETKHSFVTPTTISGDNELRLNILKDIIADKLAAEEAVKRKAANRIEREKLLEALAAKDEKAMKGKSRKQLMKELEALDI